MPAAVTSAAAGANRRRVISYVVGHDEAGTLVDVMVWAQDGRLASLESHR